MKRIVHMLNSMGMGGIENFIMNVYRNIDKNEYQFDFILQNNDRSFFEDEIESMGGKIFKIPRIEKDYNGHIMELKKILTVNKYIAFHRHTASSVCYIDLVIAKNCGIATRIVHSHSTSNRLKFFNYMFRQKLYKNATVHLACGIKAGKWLYGNNDFEIIHNGIDLDKYKFSEDKRKKYRDEFNISDNEILIGHVGRFDEAKNHKFLIKVFNERIKKNKNYKLLLCGSGKLQDEIKKQCGEYGILQNVIFAGIRNDINDILNSVDIFAFPSLYEGLPIVLIESQSTNIPCIISENIPDEAIYNDNIIKLGIDNKDINKWCEKIMNIKNDNDSRLTPSTKLLGDYDIKNVTNKLCEIYK